MRDKNRITQILKHLEILWKQYPDFRLTQLLTMIAKESGWDNNDLFHLEDDVIDRQIDKMLIGLLHKEFREEDKFPSDRINITLNKDKSLLDKIRDGDKITCEDVYGNQDGLESSDIRRGR